MKEINIEEIMDEIRSNISKRGYSDHVLKFDDVVMENSEMTIERKGSEFEHHLYQANREYEVSYYTPIAKHGLKNFVKRAIRKVMAFLILPMNVQQNTFNASVVRTLNSLQQYIDDNLIGIQSNINVTERGMCIEQQKAFFEYHEKQVEKLETKIIVLERTIQELEKKLEKIGK